MDFSQDRVYSKTFLGSKGHRVSNVRGLTLDPNLRNLDHSTQGLLKILGFQGPGVTLNPYTHLEQKIFNGTNKIMTKIPGSDEYPMIMNKKINARVH